MFKLIRLRDEDNINNHYYTSSMIRSDIDDLGDIDNIFHHSIRMTVPSFNMPS